MSSPKLSFWLHVERRMSKANFAITILTVLIGFGIAVSWIFPRAGLSANLENDESVSPLPLVRVPEQYATIQQAIDAAPDGSTVLVSPGVYHESVSIDGKSIHLASWLLTTRDERYVRQTILDGSIPANPDSQNDEDTVREQVVLVSSDAKEGTAIVGFTIRDGDDGISCHAKVRILFNYFVNNSDGIDYEGGGGICRFNRFVANDDDAVDLDGPCEALIANNEIRDNDDDGIEIRLHPYNGRTLNIDVRDNVITGNGEDGVQIIDYPNVSDRRIVIERNFIACNAMAGIGCMADGVTRENYEGAPIPEPLTITNNTILENDHGLTGGANARVINNVLVSHRHSAMKNVNGRSVIAYNLLWNNGIESIGCNLDDRTVVRADPKLDDAGKPAIDSPCVDAGTLDIDLGSDTQPVTPQSYRGDKPDLGAYESNG